MKIVTITVSCPGEPAVTLICHDNLGDVSVEDYRDLIIDGCFKDEMSTCDRCGHLWPNEVFRGLGVFAEFLCPECRKG